MVALAFQGVADLLQAGLMADRRPGVRLRPMAFGGVLVPGAVHLVKPLSLGVPGLEVVITERPGRRKAVQVVDLAEVLGPQTVEGRAVQLGGPADKIVDLGLERPPGAVVPRIGRDVLPVDEDGLGAPVVHLPGQEVASLEQQDPFTRRRQRVGQGAAAGARTDDDDVIVLWHGNLPCGAGIVTGRGCCASGRRRRRPWCAFR